MNWNIDRIDDRVVGCWRRIFDRSFDDTFHSFGSARHCGDVSVCHDIVGGGGVVSALPAGAELPVIETSS